MSSRPKRTLVSLYVVGLLLPWTCLAALSRREIATWLTTGMCPGGPMDRPAAPCGPLSFFAIVFLGGWAAFLVVPLLLVWWAGCTGALFATLKRLTRRARGDGS